MVCKGTFNHEVLIERDFVDDNDLGLVVVDKNLGVVISAKDVGKIDYGLEQMKEVGEDKRDKVVKDCLDVGDSVEIKVLQGLATDLFKNNYLSRQKPALPIMKQQVVINLKGSKIFHTTQTRYRLPENVE